jgi:uroporphyrinogen-III synthase
MPAPLILLTRPRAAAQEVAERLVRAGVPAAQVLVAPLMETVPTGAAWSLDGYAGLVFTSAEGVRHAAAAHDLRWCRAWCVGDHTAEIAAAAGMDAQSAGGAADDLVALLIRHRPQGRLLHLGGTETRGDLVGRLTRAGIAADAVAIYRQYPQPIPSPTLSRLYSATSVIAPAYSPLSAQRLAEALADMADRTHLIAISPAAAAAWPAPGPARILVAEAPDGPAMERAILAALRVETGPASS